MLTKQEEIREYCSKCNRCLTDEKGTTIMGLKIMVSGLDKNSKLREQLGKYASPEEDSFVFRLCYECWLDSLLLSPG